MINKMTFRLWAATTETVSRRQERGANLVEYAMLIALIAAVCVGAVSLLGGKAPEPYSQLGSQLSN